MPGTAGELLRAVEERFGTSELQDLARLSGVPRMTLQNWRERTKAPLRQHGRAHFKRLFEDAPESAARESVAAYAAATPAPDLASIAAALTRIEQRLDALMTLRSEPGRLEQMVTAKSKAKKAGGGAA